MSTDEIHYQDLPRKIKKGLKRKLENDLQHCSLRFQIKTVEKCPIPNLRHYADYKGYVITHYQLY